MSSKRKFDFTQLDDYEKLTLQQKLFLYLVFHGRFNLLLTGPAGVGKSWLLDYVAKVSRRIGRKVQFTSTTGVSATLLPNGCTLHSFLGCGLAKGDPREIGRKAAQNKELRHRIEKTDVLVIDEISMCEPRLLDVVDQIAKAVHKSHLPFGGKLQVILVGDFGQLRPVQDKRAPDFLGNMKLSDESITYLKRFEDLEYCFQHPDWSTLLDCSVSLEQVFRQSDADFVNLLGRVRFGRHTPEDVKLLQEKESGGQGEAQNDEYISMYAVNQQVDQKNNEEMDRIAPDPKDRHSFSCKTKMFKPTPFNRFFFEKWIENQKANCLAKPVIELAIGAKVMLVANIEVETGLANGVDGKVVGFNPLNGYPIVRLPKTRSLYSYSSSSSSPISTQAVTTKKEEEDSDCEADKKVKQEEGVVVVKVGLPPLPDNFQDVEISPFRYKYEDYNASEEGEEGGEDEQAKGHYSKKRKRNDQSDVSKVVYEQMPLRVSFGISMHKSQGQTIRKGYLDASRIFDKGQFYVALSRMKSLDGLILKHFKPSCIQTSNLMVGFYDKLRVENGKWLERITEYMSIYDKKDKIKVEAGENIALTNEMWAMEQVVKEIQQKRSERLGLLSSFF